MCGMVYGARQVLEEMRFRGTLAAWVKERKDSWVGGRGHSRRGANEVEGDDEEEMDKDQPKESPKDKDKGKVKAIADPKEKAKDKGRRNNKAHTTGAVMSQQPLQSQS